jgi:hypothetical protein
MGPEPRTFGRTEIAVPRAQILGEDGKKSEWKSKALCAYQRRTQAADALIASTVSVRTDTRRVRRPLAALFGGAVSKIRSAGFDGRVKGDCEAWNPHSLAPCRPFVAANAENIILWKNMQNFEILKACHQRSCASAPHESSRSSSRRARVRRVSAPGTT